MKKVTVDNVSAPKRITKIQFGTMTAQEIRKSAELAVTSRELYQHGARVSAPNGMLDPRMGISDKTSSCQTCK
jgi:DNA-directed RNA polymerase III subunit RPC1